MDDAPQVDAEGPVPVVESDVTDGCAADPDSGVVDHQGGCRAEGQFGEEGEVLDLFARGDVADDGVGGAAVLDDESNRFLGAGKGDVRADDLTSALGQFECEGAADAAARAGYDGASVVGLSHEIRLTLTMPFVNGAVFDGAVIRVGDARSGDE